MQKQRLKIWVLPAQCGKKSFGTVWDNTVSILRQGSLLHCSARCTKSLLALPNDNECLNKNVLAHDFVYRSFLRPEGQNQSTGDTFCNARRDSNPRISSLTGSRSKCSSGIHFGISSCTAVKDLTQTPAWSNLASIFYHSVHRFSRKKSCENTRRVQFFNKLNEHLRRAEIFLAVWTTAFRKRKRNIS